MARHDGGMGVSARYDWVGGYTAVSGPLTAKARLGGSGEPAGTLTFADGTGAGQANFVYSRAISLAATTYLDIDLKGGGGELDVLNVAMAATAVKLVLLEITTPASGTSLRFGPQNRTNAAQLWFQDVTANFYVTVLDKFYMCDARAGWALDATHKVISLYNPGASTVAATLRVVGTK